MLKHLWLNDFHEHLKKNEISQNAQVAFEKSTVVYRAKTYTGLSFLYLILPISKLVLLHNDTLLSLKNLQI